MKKIFLILVCSIVVLIALLIITSPAEADHKPYLKEFKPQQVIIRWDNVPTEYCWHQYWATVRIVNIETGKDEPWSFVYPAINCKYDGEVLYQEWVWDFQPSCAGIFRPVSATIHDNDNTDVVIPVGFEFQIYQTNLSMVSNGQ